MGDLDGTGIKLNKGFWKAVVTITLHDAGGNPVADATVGGTFFQNGNSIGPLICVTDVSGTCAIDSEQFPSRQGKATFVVDYVTHTLSYEDAANHDPDGDSDGTSIALSK